MGRGERSKPFDRLIRVLLDGKTLETGQAEKIRRLHRKIERALKTNDLRGLGVAAGELAKVFIK